MTAMLKDRMIILTHVSRKENVPYAFQDESSKKDRANGASGTNGEAGAFLLLIPAMLYGLTVFPNGGAEQIRLWWDALCVTTRNLLPVIRNGRVA